MLDGQINPLNTIAFVAGEAPPTETASVTVKGTNSVEPSPAQTLKSVHVPDPTYPPAHVSVNLPPVAVKVLNKTSNRVTLQISNPQPGFLYIDQTYFPGWKATINGQQAKLYRANVAFTALPVEAGELKIELVYDPISFWSGLWLTVVGLILTGLFTVCHRLRWVLKLKSLEPV